MVKILECVGARYEVQDVEDVEIAKVYRWRPAIVTIECVCGERAPLTPSKTTCIGCAADHTDVFAEVLETRMEEEDEGDHPWRSLRSYFPPQAAPPKPI